MQPTLENKESWGPGPWRNEPDELHWTDKETGLDCMIRRGQSGALCGYVGVPVEHPLHGVDCGVPDIRIHGGLTWSSSSDDGWKAPGNPDLWWFGFDCAHHGDLMPFLSAFSPAFNRLAKSVPDTYRTLEYVEAECAELAKQLRTTQSTPPKPS